MIHFIVRRVFVVAVASQGTIRKLVLIGVSSGVSRLSLGRSRILSQIIGPRAVVHQIMYRIYVLPGGAVRLLSGGSS